MYKFYFLELKNHCRWKKEKSLQMVTEAMKLKDACFFGRKAMTNLDSILKNRDITLLTRVHIVKAMVFSSSRVWMWELEHKEGWVPKNWYFWIMVLEKSLESPLDCKEIKPVNPKGSDQIRSVAQSCPTLCDPMNRSTPGLPVHHQLSGCEFGQTLRDSGGQQSLACCSPWSCKE